MGQGEEVPSIQALPPVVVAENRHLGPQLVERRRVLFTGPVEHVHVQHHHLGTLAAKGLLQQLLGLKGLLGQRAAHKAGDPVGVPELQGHETAVGQTVPQKEHINGVPSLGEDPVGIRVQGPRLRRVVFRQHQQTGRNQKQAQNGREENHPYDLFPQCKDPFLVYSLASSRARKAAASRSQAL